MKKLAVFILCLFLSFSLLAQNDTIIKSYYDNGNVKEILSFNDNNKIDGTCFTYTEDGIMTGLASYKDGVKHGEWKIWRSDGTLAYEMYYEKGEKVGKWRMYDEKGNLIKERDF